MYGVVVSIYNVISIYGMTLNTFLSIYSGMKMCRKRRLTGAVSRNNRMKGAAPCRFLDGHVKEPYEMSMALGA